MTLRQDILIKLYNLIIIFIKNKIKIELYIFKLATQNKEKKEGLIMD